MANTKDNAYEWLEKAAQIMNSKTDLPPVEDEIFRFEDIDVFNYSKINGIKFFIEKNDETRDDIKIIFYQKDKTEDLVSLKIGDYEYKIDLNKDLIFDLGFNQDNIDEVTISYGNQEQSLTETICKIKHNTLERL